MRALARARSCLHTQQEVCESAAQREIEMIKELAAFRATRAQFDADASEREAERARTRESVRQAELARSEATQREEKLVAEVHALQVLE